MSRISEETLCLLLRISASLTKASPLFTTPHHSCVMELVAQSLQRRAFVFRPANV